MVREAAKHEMGVTQCVAGAPWCTYRYRIEPYRNIDYRKFIEYRTLFGTVFGTDIDTIIYYTSVDLPNIRQSRKGCRDSPYKEEKLPIPGIQLYRARTLSP